MRKKTEKTANEFKQIGLRYVLIGLLNIISLVGISSCAMTTHKGFEKEVIINDKAAIHYSQDIAETIPTQIAQFMTKNGFINPMIPTEIYLNVENNTYRLKFVKEEDVLAEKKVVFSFNALEIKLNSALNLDKKLVIEFTDKDLTKVFALPRGRDIISETAEEIFKLKTYSIDNFHTIQYNETMPISDLKIVANAVSNLKNDFPENRRINVVFINNGSDYTFKFFLLKQYWNDPSDLARSRRIVKYFNESGITKKINIMFVDFMTYEETKI
jgi:hypothetical protein